MALFGPKVCPLCGKEYKGLGKPCKDGAYCGECYQKVHVLIDGIGGYPYCPEEHPTGIAEGEDGALLIKDDIGFLYPGDIVFVN